MGFFDIFTRKAEVACPDGYPLMLDSIRKDEHLAINAYLFQVITPEEPYCWKTDPKAHEAGRHLLAGSPEARVRLVLALIERMAFLSHQKNPYHLYDIHVQVFSPLMRSRLPFSEQDLSFMIEALKEQKPVYSVDSTVRPVLSQVEHYVSRSGLSPELQKGMEQLKKKHLSNPDYADLRKLARRIGILIGDVRQSEIEPGEPWTDMMRADLDGMGPEEQAVWKPLIEHSLMIKSSEPSQKWLAQADRHREAVGKAAFRDLALRWLVSATRGTGEPMSEPKADLLKGLIWQCYAVNDADLTRAICDVALSMFKKIPGIGPRSVKAGNACIHVLSRLPGMEAVAQLSRLQLKVKYSKVHSLINTALEEAAAKAGMTRTDLEEIAVPTFGLEGQSILREELGEHVAEIRVTGSVDAELVWLRKDGKAQKSVPAAVQQHFSEELSSLKRIVKDIENMLPAQRDRIERLFLSRRSWPYPVWRERYLDHPLLAQLTRRLVWHFERQGNSGLAIPDGDGLKDAEGRIVEWQGEDTVVRLWHPVGFEVAMVREWREYLEKNAISQPFKQAHRELYILTDAELATRTYSNRFAAHILKQHQFSALCKQRAWKYQLQGAFDSFSTPTLELPQWGLRAEFWVESVAADDQQTEAGIYLYVTTDQVRFTNLQGEQLPVAEVPALAFTEVMRDVDLFVGVCSVGNDPLWQDQGQDRFGADYWQQYSFGNLSVQAETRKDVLMRLLPRLAIADKCSLDGKFLVVRGDMRTYKIHLGSGNILMEPNDQYLCIVPDRSGAKGKAEKVFLPFEGDSMFSIVLSKAFLLAKDGQIKDETIMRQIKGK